MNALLIILGAVIGILVSLLRSQFRTRNATAKIIDLTSKLNQQKTDEGQSAKKADEAVKEYTDALKKYDPHFHDDSDDDGGTA